MKPEGRLKVTICFAAIDEGHAYDCRINVYGINGVT